MLSWAPYVFVRFVIFFAAGILLGIYHPGLVPHIAVIVFVILAGLFTVITFLRSANGAAFFNPGFAGLLALFVAGYACVFYSTDSNRKDHFIHDSDTITFYKANIINQVQEKENSWKVEAEVSAVQHTDSLWEDRFGKVLLYFSKSDFDSAFQYGDILLVKGRPQPLPEPSNPGEFDYKTFLTFRKIYHQHFLRDESVMKIGHQPENAMIDYSIRARIWANEILKRNVNGEKEQGIASALVLGVTDGLDSELLGAYGATGSLHVLSVSGLHVGIIYWLILLILKPLSKTATGKWFLAIFSLIVLWGYAFITGLSPSVLRAVTMFSFVALAKPWSKRTNIFNTLAASAFCLLLFEPYLIMSVGFQLSYLAVLGIVYLQSGFTNLWKPRGWLWQNTWQITCVSIAAQIATCSLGLLYFHQFPVYFLFSNLFVIPVSFVVLVLGIVLVVIGFIQPMASVTGFLLEWTIKVMNYGVLKIEALPYSVIDNIYITTLQCWLLIAVVIFVIILIEYKRFRYVIAAAFCISVFSMIDWMHFHEEVDQQRLTVYKVSDHSALDIFDRGKAYFFTDSVLAGSTDKVRFHIRPNRLKNGVGNIADGNHLDIVRHFKGCSMIVWSGITILQIHGKDFSFPESHPVDFVILGKNAIRSLTDISALKFQKLILDSSNSFYFAERILKEARASSLDVYSVLHQGAFTVKLKVNEIH